MPRQITFKTDKKKFTSSPVKIDRRKLYGWSELTATDDDGNPCELLTSDESGRYIIPLGGTANGILSDDGRWVERSELETVGADGKPAKLFTSSFDAENPLSDRVTPQELLDYSITDFYQLDGADDGLAEAVGDNIYRFEYSYNDSYDPSPAFVMAANGTLFLLIAERNDFEWLCFGDCETIDDDIDEEALENSGNDIDFSML